MAWYNPISWFKKKPQVAEEPDDFNKPAAEPAEESSVVAEEPDDFNKPAAEPAEESSVVAEVRDFEAEHEELLKKLKMIDLKEEEDAKDITTLIATPVTEVGKGIRKNALAQKIAGIIKDLETEKQDVKAMAAENIGGQMLNFQQQIAQLEEMSQEKIDKTMPLDSNQTEDKIRDQHGNELGNLWSAYRHSVTRGRRLQTDINKRVKALHSEISKFQETEISTHQTSLTQLEDELREYEEELQSIADQLPTATERKRITQLQNGIGTLIQKHKKRTNLKTLETFEEKLGQIAIDINNIFEEKQKLIAQRDENKIKNYDTLKNYHAKRKEVHESQTSSDSAPAPELPPEPTA